MKKAELFIYSLFAVGIVFKLFKLPMHTVFLLLTLLILIIYYTVGLIKRPNERYLIFTGFLTVLWLFCFLAVLKHFSFLNIVWIVSLVSSVVLLLLYYKNKAKISGISILCSIVIATTIFLKFLPAYHTYYLTNIKFNYEIDTDYFSWDKYSWFLYREGKETEALQANEKAQKALDKCLQNPMYGDENEYKTLIENHQLMIKNKAWKVYP